MNPSVDVKELLQQSTSDIPLSELAKKGFKQVKVLNRDAINQLIQQAVDRVASAAEQMTEEQRQAILEESQGEFQRLLAKARQDDLEKETRLQEQLDAVTTEKQDLAAALAERDAAIRGLDTQVAQLQGELNAMRAGGGGGLGSALTELLLQLKSDSSRKEDDASANELQSLKQSIDSLATKISQSGFVRKDGSAGGAAEAGPAIDALLERLGEGGDPIESNVANVTVKKAKAKGVGGTLEKLRSMQKGNGGGDE